MRSVEEEIKLLINTNNEHVSKFYAVQLKLEDPGKASQLSILVDKEPALSLHALLDECDRLREERASVSSVKYLTLPNSGAFIFFFKGLPVSNSNRTECHPRYWPCAQRYIYKYKNKLCNKGRTNRAERFEH